MKAAAVLEAAMAAGVHIKIDNGDLVLEANAPPAPGIVDALSSQKAAIIALLETQDGIPNSENCVPLFPERVLTRSVENRSLSKPRDVHPCESAIAAWLNNHPVLSPPDRCAWCFRPERPDHTVVPFGIHSRGHVWLHAECWDPWQQHRRQMATRALDNKNIQCRTSIGEVHAGEVFRPKVVVESPDGAADDNWINGDDKP